MIIEGVNVFVFAPIVVAGITYAMVSVCILVTLKMMGDV